MTDDFAALDTEQRHPATSELEMMSVERVIETMHRADDAVTAALADAAPQLAEAARQVAEAVGQGRRLAILGAGTGGRLAIQEVSELPPTFGIDPDTAFALVASRAPVGPAAVTTTEDDTDAAGAELARRGIGAGDVVIGVAASGRTPFVVAGIEAARVLGAWTAGLANNAGTPLLREADLGILLATGPEILTGSTRLKAGTAQKIALNRITTAAMVSAGRVTSNHMTHMRVTNSKLRARAVRMVTDLLDVTPDEATAQLELADWDVAAVVS